MLAVSPRLHLLRDKAWTSYATMPCNIPAPGLLCRLKKIKMITYFSQRKSIFILLPLLAFCLEQQRGPPAT